YVAVGMTHMHLARAPGHVRRRPGDLDALLHAALVRGVDVLDPHRHPDALLERLVRPGAERHRQAGAPAAALPAFAEENLALVAADAAERRRRAPIPGLLPAELLEPLEALLEVRDVQDRRQVVNFHGDCATSFFGALRSHDERSSVSTSRVFAFFRCTCK